MPRLRVVPWSADWARMFEVERGRLATVFDRPGEVVEHIGSTAVEGLAAKPIIDIVVGVETLADAEARIPVLESLGYEYVPGYESELPDRRYFRRPRTRPRTYHLHCLERGGVRWAQHLAFRDYLRAHPERAEEYQTLKQRLAARHVSDPTAYLDGKAPFIRGILEELES